METKQVGSTRFYNVEGEYLPSVTSITSATLPKGIGYEHWLCKFDSRKKAMEYRDERAEIGTELHDNAEKLLKDKEPNLVCSKEVRKMTVNLREFLDEKDFYPLKIEFPVYSKKYGYAGRVDLLALEGDQLWVLDFKTSKGIYESHQYQIMMYRLAIEEMGDYSPDKMGFIRVRDKKVEFEEFKMSLEETKRRVKAIMTLYEDFKYRESPSTE